MQVLCCPQLLAAGHDPGEIEIELRLGAAVAHCDSCWKVFSGQSELGGKFY